MNIRNRYRDAGNALHEPVQTKQLLRQINADIDFH